MFTRGGFFSGLRKTKTIPPPLRGPPPFTQGRRGGASRMSPSTVFIPICSLFVGRRLGAAAKLRTCQKWRGQAPALWCWFGFVCLFLLSLRLFASQKSTVSLRLGPPAALTVHRTVIHYRGMPLRHLVRGRLFAQILHYFCKKQA